MGGISYFLAKSGGAFGTFWKSGGASAPPLIMGVTPLHIDIITMFIPAKRSLLQFVLQGSTEHCNDVNYQIFQAMYTYIQSTGRFHYPAN